MHKANLLWVDLEMTGLSPADDRIVEVAAIATDFDLSEVARYQAAVQVTPELLQRRMVGDFWEEHDATRQALMAASLAPTAKSSVVIESELIQLVQTQFDLSRPIYLAGNSIHQDQKFIEREWPDFNRLFSYRMLDVSAWKIVFEQRGIKFTKPEAHRAMSDIEGSMAELKYYLQKAGLNDRK